MLTQKEIEEFKQITMKVYGIGLNDAESRDQGERLLRIMELMGLTLSQEDLIYKTPVDNKKVKR